MPDFQADENVKEKNESLNSLVRMEVIYLGIYYIIIEGYLMN